MIQHSYKINQLAPTISFSMRDESGRNFSVNLIEVDENNISLSLLPSWFTMVTSSLYINTGKIYPSASYVDITISINTSDPSFNTESVYRFVLSVNYDSSVVTHSIDFYGAGFEIDQQAGISEIWSARYTTHSGRVTVNTISAFVNSARSANLSDCIFYENRGASVYYFSQSSNVVTTTNLLDTTSGSSFSIYAVVGYLHGRTGSVTTPYNFINFRNSGGITQFSAFIDKVYYDTFSVINVRAGFGFIDTNGTISGVMHDVPPRDMLSLNIYELHCYGNVAEYWINGSLVYKDTAISTDRFFEQFQFGYPTTLSKWFMGDLIVITTSLTPEEKRRIRRKLFYIYNTPYTENESIYNISVYQWGAAFSAADPYTYSMTVSVYAPPYNESALSYTLSADSATEIVNYGTDLDSNSHFEFISNSITYATVSASINPGETHTYVVHWTRSTPFAPNLYHMPAFIVTTSIPTTKHIAYYTSSNYRAIIVDERTSTEHIFYGWFWAYSV